MVTTTKTGLALEFSVDGESISEYFYKNNTVKSGDVNIEVTVEDYREAIKNIDEWIVNVGRINREELTVGSISTNVREEVTEADGDIKLNLFIGDLTLEVKYNKTTKKIQVTRSAYNLNWTDFLHFINRYRDFIKVYIASYI